MKERIADPAKGKRPAKKPEVSDFLSSRRKDHEPPAAIAKRGWRYRHLEIPTSVKREGEVHLKQFGLHVSGFDTSPFK